MTSPEIHFVISAPRSGSTWLAQALNQHPEIFATEHRLFGNFCEMWPNNNGKLAPRITFDAYARALSVHYFHNEFAENREEFIDQFIQRYSRFLLNFATDITGKKIIVDKITPYPGTTDFVVSQIRKHFPDAKIIKLIRDGRDVLTSGTFDWLLKDGKSTERYRRFVEQDAAAELKRFFDDDAVDRWAKIWAETISEVSQADLEVRFEQMLENQPKVLMQIFELLGVSSTDELATGCAGAVTFEKMTGRSPGQMEPTAKQRCGVSGDWEKYFTKHDGKLFHGIAGAQLISTGYVQNESWFEDLPDQLAIRCDSDNQGAMQS